MLLAKVAGTAYLLYGLFGLLVVSIPENRQDMFFGSESSLLSNLRLLHAYVLLLFMVACGVAVWLQPTMAVLLAWVVLGMLLAGKMFNLFSGRKIKCVRCLVTGVSLVSLATFVITVGVA